VKIARVIGRVWATAKHDTLEGRKILLVRPLDHEGRSVRSAAYLAIDSVGAGAGERVLVLDEGNGAGQVLGLDAPPVRTVVVGVIDEVRSEGSGG
jgi:ethanolamine utilization protein EutN